MERDDQITPNSLLYSTQKYLLHIILKGKLNRRSYTHFIGWLEKLRLQLLKQYLNFLRRPFKFSRRELLA
ncbi:hypothetical protein BRADI_1g53105v3 [Brachypodium distachyon]|uniref:Uncharacterized protein n=1 Tax=Brachypodium distachyon TaxID=15368 RepID=A0A2K2DR59_BRADI|nr:hypothetical protein BRADI_1g53105v3 [Brachypodium distachyon]